MNAPGATADTGAEEPRALEVVEEAVALLKRAGIAAFGAYAAGTLGFLWALLYFWAYMSRNALADARLSEFSLLLAVAFAFMKFCHALFFRRLMQVQEQVQEEAGPSPASTVLMVRTILAQTLLQPWALFALPAALLLTIPYPFAAAFFQNAQWLREKDGFGEWMARSIRVARLWPKQNMYLHLFLAGAFLAVFVNLASGLVAGPMLLKTMFGVETVFSRSPSAYLNSTFILMVFGLTWAALDPVIKAIHAWRCFHGLSLRTGLDLRLALERLEPAVGNRRDAPRIPAAPALFTLVAFLAAAGQVHGNPTGSPVAAPRTSAVAYGHVATPAASHVHAAFPSASTSTSASALAPAPTVSPERLDALLKDEIAESRYGWRLPRHSEAEDQESWLFRQLKKAYQSFRRLVHKVQSLWDKFEDWFNGLFTPGKDAKKNLAPAAPSPLPTRVLVMGLCALFLAGIAAFLIRRARMVTVAAAAPIAPAAKAPDVLREDVKADDFPEEEWLRLMERLRAEGQNRLALRALFLAMLSLLSRKGWVSVARYKSNRDYQREVASRARRRPGVSDSFRENCLRFDRIWYGAYEITGEDWEISQANFAKVRQSEA